MQSLQPARPQDSFSALAGVGQSGPTSGAPGVTAGGGVEGARTGHLNPSNEPGRVALVCRIVSLRAFAALIAFHPGAELVERHGAEHPDPLAEHPERHPHGEPLQHSQPIQG